MDPIFADSRTVNDLAVKFRVFIEEMSASTVVAHAFVHYEVQWATLSVRKPSACLRTSP
jgi:hypothetical protein